MNKKVLLVCGYGINSEHETAYAADLASASKVSILHINEIIISPSLLDEYDVIIFPGGFSYGDNLGAGFAFASIVKITLADKIHSMIDAGKMFIGICNGCQILVKLGLFNYHDKKTGLKSKISITHNHNDIGYQCKWVDCNVLEDVGNQSISLPVAHGEGRFLDLDENLDENRKKALLSKNYINENCRIFLKYTSDHNGSCYNTAGITNSKANVIALMPHAERAIIYQNYMNKDNAEIENIYISFFKQLLI